MIEKTVAVDILTDIQDLLNANEQERAIKTINIYIKNLEVAINPKIKKLIEQHKQYIEKYGEEGRRTVNLGKKIGKEIEKIFNKKEDV